MDIFVYGTLRSARLMAAVAGGHIDRTPATLHGYAVGTLGGDVVPMIFARKDAVVDGVLYTGLDAAQCERLDLFEGAFGYALIDVTVETASGSQKAKMYEPPADAKVADFEWSLEEWENNHLAAMLHAVDEVFSYDPGLDQASLRRMWPMIEKRAWAKHRAAGMAAPATLRYAPKDSDVTLHSFDPPTGGFFRFDAFQVDHKRFDGQRSGDLNREVFVGTDAALILPYDAASDRVLLVEQLRLGPALRGDPNPWSLEPIAGMVDARETPLEAALREAKEEAGLDIPATEFMMAFYPSPGNATDYFSCYLGKCELPARRSYQGGLESESEDLRLHTLDVSDALQLVSAGEIAAGPLIAMLFWLDRERPRLRAQT